MSTKKCIFHYPKEIETNPTVGSGVRPHAMLQAFKNIGYEVDEIVGDSRSREKSIKKIKKDILHGAKYDFLYSESTTMPTALTDQDHFPRHPFMDERFFRFCNHHNVPVGLFYRDAYWMFPEYKKNVQWWVPLITIPFYKHEFKSYQKIVDMLFVGSIDFIKTVEYQGNVGALPSGGYINIEDRQSDSKIVRLLYIGGIVGINDIKLVIDVIQSVENIHLTLCCPIEEWQGNNSIKNISRSKNISVVHEKGKGLRSLYKDADIALALYDRNTYRDMAMPVKIFDYICNGKPIITTKNTSAGDFIESNKIGWTIDYDHDQFTQLLKSLKDNKAQINERKENVKKIAEDNTWEARATSVAKVLNTTVL